MSSACNSSHGQGLIPRHQGPLAIFTHLAVSISLSFSNPYLWICRQIRILKGDLCPPPPSSASLWGGWFEHPQTCIEGGGGCVLSGILLLILHGEGMGKECFPLHRLPSPTRQPHPSSISASQCEETLRWQCQKYS